MLCIICSEVVSLDALWNQMKSTILENSERIQASPYERTESGLMKTTQRSFVFYQRREPRNTLTLSNDYVNERKSLSVKSFNVTFRFQ